MRANNVKGAVVMVIAVGSLALMDACMKSLSAAYPPMQVAALRALSSLPFIAAWIGATGGFAQLRRVRFGLHVFRAGINIVTLWAFIFGVSGLPLSEAYAIFFAAPLFITALAVPLLGERVEWQRWAAIIVGLSGVVIVLRPTGSGVVSLAGLSILFAALGYAISAITTRVLGRTDTTQSMVFWVLALMAAGASALALPQWRPIETSHWLPILGMAITGSVGQWALTEAFRIGEASFLAPFEYTALAWGLALDWLLWQTMPGARALAGAAVIVTSGIYLVHRETVAAPVSPGAAVVPDE